MVYHYEVYRIPIISDIQLPSLLEGKAHSMEPPIRITQGKVPDSLQNKPLVENLLGILNENEILFEIPNVARYYIANGNYICVEPISAEHEMVLLYVYNQCLAGILLQRNLILYHVSGIFTKSGKVVLFAAPSKTGKSTTAMMLKQKGYAIFTDDTAILQVRDNQVFARASYPIMRLWQSSFAQQSLYKEDDKRVFSEKLMKFGFSIHENFATQDMPVAAIVFLKQNGDKIRIEKLKPASIIQNLGNNIYRVHWLMGMKKQKLKFESLTKLANSLEAWEAIRPLAIDTFDSFASVIENEIIDEIDNTVNV